MTREEMAKRGYSRVFRECFELLGRYADAPDENGVWESMARESCTLYEDLPEELQALAKGILLGIYDLIDRAQAQPKLPESLREEPQYYHFTL